MINGTCFGYLHDATDGEYRHLFERQAPGTLTDFFSQQSRLQMNPTGLPFTRVRLMLLPGSHLG